MTKQFFTSFYAKSAGIRHAVRISVKAPDYFEGFTYPPLYPSFDIVMGTKKGLITFDEYKSNYFNLLTARGVTPEQVYNDLPDGAVLLCYEPDPTFCHRRLVAEWLEDSLRIHIPELDRVDFKHDLTNISFDD